MWKMRSIALGILLLTVPASAAAANKDKPSKSPKYYFKISNIITQDRKIIPMAKDLLEKEYRQLYIFWLKKASTVY